jgi:SAM-dependent methyltransferase
MALNDPQEVRREYATDAGLATRAAAHRFGSGPDALQLTFEAIAEGSPQRVLEVGCGQGKLADRVRREVTLEVIGLDQSEHMVELTRARGVEAVLGDVQDLPFADEAFDCVVAAWMLYHVPDIEQGLAEIRRVLEPAGRLVVVTNAQEHLRELSDLIEFERLLPFHSDEAEAVLRAGFASVDRRDVYGWTDFPDRAAAQEYLDASPSLGGRQLPEFDGPLRVRRAPTIFIATKAA